MAPSKAAHASLVTPFGERAKSAVHPLTAYLYRLMEVKSSNLCVSADVSTARELLLLADRVGPAIVVLKTHYDLVSGWDYHPQTGTGAKLAALARKHGFLLFEDRKFADIGKTVQQQYTAGTARIIDWAHMVTVNMDAGPAAVTALQDAADHWRGRVHYEVKTSVSVGTPLSTATEDASEEEKDEAMEDATVSNNLPQPGSGFQREGRKASVVSITTVTKQSYEPVESPRPPQSETEECASTSDNKDSSSAAKASDVFSGIEEAPLERGILLLAQMSSKGSLMTPAYTQACVEAARAHPKFVLGFIAQETLNRQADDTFAILTPGCKLPPAEEDSDDEDEGGKKKNTTLAGDGMGQQYNTPSKLIGQCGTDIVIVGRGIIAAADPPSEALRYQKKAWKAYKARLW